MQTPATPVPAARDGVLGLETLPWLDAQEVAHRNADLALLRRWVFAVGGAPIRFERTPDAVETPAAASPALWLSLSWSGLPLVAGVSAALADAVAQSLANVTMEQLGPSGIELFAQLMLTPRLPAGLILHQATLQRDDPAPSPTALEVLGTWQGRHPGSGEASGHAVTLWAAPGFPLASLLAACAGWAASQQASPLAGLPITLPLVAARWQVEAGALVDLAVGDVLILG